MSIKTDSGASGDGELEHALAGDEGTGDSGAGNGEGNGGTGAGEGGESAAATKFAIDGQEYSVDQLKEALKAAGDYQQLLPEFTRKSQLLSEVQKKLGALGQLDEKAADSSKPNDPRMEQARKILKEQLGAVFAEDLQPILELVNALKAQREDAALHDVADSLADKYDGSHGEPKFDVVKVAEAVKQNPQLAVYVAVDGQYLVDLEQTYKKVNATFWDKVPETKAAPVLRTERGAGTRTAAPTGTKKAETDEERVASALDYFRSAAPQE